MALKERPILFGGEMIRAILGGRKSVTRRVLKPQPIEPGATGVDRSNCEKGDVIFFGGASGTLHRLREPRGRQRADAGFLAAAPLPCPYGQPGDRLWVREAWRPWCWREDIWVFEYAADGARSEIQAVRPADHLRFEDWEERTHERLHDECTALGLPLDDEGAFHWQGGPNPLRWRPSIHMPRWASRLDLEVTSVRVERVQEITTADVWSEGVQIPTSENGGVLWRLAPDNAAGKVPASYLAHGRLHPGQPPATEDELARSHFADLWDSLNAKRDHPWESNPWVWVVEFERLTP